MMLSFNQRFFLGGALQCSGSNVFIKEADVTMRGANEMLRIKAFDIKDCTDKCRDERGQLNFHCHSFVYTNSTNECVLYEADILNPNIDFVSSPTSDLYQVICIQGEDDSVSHLRSGDTAALYGRDSLYLEDPVPFQRYRKYRLQADYMKTLQGLDLGRCLDECLHQTITR